MYRQILHLLEDGHPHTAEEFMQQVGLTRAQLHQAVTTLQGYALPIHRPTPTCYQLPGRLELLDPDQITAYLPAESYSQLKQLIVLDVVNSTNDYAFAHTEVPLACLAEYQTQGKGRQGRRWFSPYASGLCLSLKYRYASGTGSLNGLNIALAVSIAQLLQTLGVENLGIKWPNDLWWHGKKLAGLLLEIRMLPHDQQEVVFGLGLNVNVWEAMPTIDQDWTDLTTIMGKLTSRNQLAALCISQCLQTLTHYPQQKLTPFQAAWEKLDLLANRQVTLTLPQGQVQGKACGIDTEGALQLQIGQTVHSYLSGEVRVSL